MKTVTLETAKRPQDRDIRQMKVLGWRPIRGYQNWYWVNEYGGVFSLYKHNLLNQHTTKSGYRTVSFSRNNRTETKKVARLVAQAFLPNPKRLPFVNHKNGDKENNQVDNLEWCTASENIAHAYKTGLKTPVKGEQNGMFGQQHTKEAKAKMSKARSKYWRNRKKI